MARFDKTLTNPAKNFEQPIFRYKNSLFVRKIVQYYKDYRTV